MSPSKLTALNKLPPTSQHGKSVFFHTRKTLSLFTAATPKSEYKKEMVVKLANVAANTRAEVVFLKEEIRRLQGKVAKINESQKVKSRKVLSKALVVSVEDVIRLKNVQDARERAAVEKRNRNTNNCNLNAEKERSKNGKHVEPELEEGISHVSKPTGSHGRKKKVTVPIVIEDSELESSSGSEQEVESSSTSAVEIVKNGGNSIRTRGASCVSKLV